MAPARIPPTNSTAPSPSANLHALLTRLLLLATLTSAVRRAAHDALPPEAASAFAAQQKPFVAALAARRPGASAHSAPAPRAFGGRPQPLLRPQATTTAAPELPSLSSLLDPLGGARVMLSELEDGANRTASWMGTLLLAADDGAAGGGVAADRAGDPPPLSRESLMATARFWDDLAAAPETIEWYRDRIPSVLYDPINTRFLAFANESGLPPPRRISSAERASLALLAPGAEPDGGYWKGGGTAEEWKNLKSLGGKGAQPHCRWFVHDAVDGVGMSQAHQSSKSGFVYWLTVSCSCMYTYWAQSMGTLLPVAIWDFLGWKEEFWRVHRWPLKLICGLLYFILNSIGILARRRRRRPLAAAPPRAARPSPARRRPSPARPRAQISLALVALFAVGYGSLLEATVKKSWELGVTQSWNKIDPSEEAKIDEAAMGGEQEEEEDDGAKKKERMVQDVVTTGKSATDIAVLALTGTTPSERAIQMAEQSRLV